MEKELKSKLADEINQLTEVHFGLQKVEEKPGVVRISGFLPFEASTDHFETISNYFSIKLIISSNYPEILPDVIEIEKKIDRNYDHINSDGTLCLAVPTEQRRIFSKQPTLLGFVNRLVIPYLYSYCYWKKHKEYPFGEQKHGVDGIVQYYKAIFSDITEFRILFMIAYLLEYGYRGHHLCPCGGGLIENAIELIYFIYINSTTSLLYRTILFLCSMSVWNCLKKKIFPSQLNWQSKLIGYY